MEMSLRSSAAWLFLIAACSGPTFTAGQPNGGGQGSQSGATMTGGKDGAGEGGGPEAPSDGGAAGAGGSSESGTAGQGGADDGGAHGLGEGGAPPLCAVACRDDEQCAATPAGPECRCAGAFVSAGEQCRLPLSCDELHRYAPSLPSAAYELQPKGAARSFLAYCGMVQEGGGWTLVLNEGTNFDPKTSGTADAVCYSSSCTSIGYSLVPINADVMMDVSDSAIAGSTYGARLIVTGVHAMSRGKTLRTLFTTGPNYLEAENNSNLAVRMRDGADCNTLPQDFATAVCQSCDTAGCKKPVLVFGDGDAAAECSAAALAHFAIGAANDYVTPWHNCAGWPQHTAYSATSFYPSYVRVWVR